MNRKYTQEHIDFLAANISGCPFKALTAKFNERFRMSISVSAMVTLTNKHGLHNGIDSRLNKGHEPTQFKKGLIPWNKGLKGTGGWEPTQFKKGHIPGNYKPVGTERVNGDGYADIKVADPNKWKGKHVLIWETVNGPVPPGHVIIFGDSNNRNFELSNLILVSRKQLVRLNQLNLIKDDTELTKTGVIIADIYNKIGERRKDKRKKGEQYASKDIGTNS